MATELQSQERLVPSEILNSDKIARSDIFSSNNSMPDLLLFERPELPWRNHSSSCKSSWLSSFLGAILHPLRFLKDLYRKWYNARARRRFLHRQSKWRRDCDDDRQRAKEMGEHTVLKVLPPNGENTNWRSTYVSGERETPVVASKLLPTGEESDDQYLDVLRAATSSTPPQGSSPRGGGSGLNSAGLQERLEENRRQREALGAEPPPDVAQYLEDERVALMLQNDEFMAELRTNREFMDSLEFDTPQFGASSSWNEYESLDDEVDKGFSQAPKYPDDEAFKERLKHMGKASRRKFAQMARLFHFSRRGGARAMLGHGPVPSSDHLLLNDDQLLPEDLDDEPPPPARPFEDRHTVETASPRDGEDRSPRRGYHQVV